MDSIKPAAEFQPATIDPDLVQRFNKVLEDAVEAMEESSVKYAFIGGIASGGLGRPRSTYDIDLFVVPEEAELALRVLEKKGFRIEKTDPTWLYKAFKDNILVDVIFKSKGEIYLDSEMYQRIITADFHGRRLKLVSPEDLVIIKAAAHGEFTPGHWHDAIALLSYATIDWAYLIKRARRAPRRVLSLLLYAQSNDIGVPNHVVHELYSGIFENQKAAKFSVEKSPAYERPYSSPPTSSSHIGSNAGLYAGSSKKADSEKVKLHLARSTEVHYSMGHLRERLAEDPRTNELDIQIEKHGNKIFLKGDVQWKERKDAVAGIASEMFPDFQIDNQIQIVNYKEPEPNDVEEIK